MTPRGKFVGIDVSKAPFDVAVRPTGAHWTRAHTERGSRYWSRASFRYGPR